MYLHKFVACKLKENIMTRFPANKLNRFWMFAFVYSCCHGHGTYVSFINEQKVEIWVLISPTTNFAHQRIRVLEGKVNETKVTLQRYLKLCSTTLNKSMRIFFKKYMCISQRKWGYKVKHKVTNRDRHMTINRSKMRRPKQDRFTWND